MIRIELAVARWAQNVDVGGYFGTSLTPSPERGVRLWYIGSGVLVEHEGKPDRFVPISQVLWLEATGRLATEQWTGEKVATAEQLAAVVDAGVAAFDDMVASTPDVFTAPAAEPKPARKKPGPKPKKREETPDAED